MNAEFSLQEVALDSFSNRKNYQNYINFPISQRRHELLRDFFAKM